MFKWLFKFFRKSGDPSPSTGEVREVEKDRKGLERRREELLYEALEIDEQIQDLFARYKETDREVLKKEILRDLTIKRAEYESLNARLERLGEAAVAVTRRSAFLQSFLDLPEVTEKDLDRLENLQTIRREQERRHAIYADRVIELTETKPETSLEAQRLQRETLEELERQAAQSNTAKAKGESREETEKKIAELLNETEAAEKRAAAELKGANTEETKEPVDEDRLLEE